MEVVPEEQPGEADEEPGGMWEDGPGNTPGFGADTGDYGRPFVPDPRVPLRPGEYETPSGPHPDKKGPSWDVYGQQRPQRPPVPRAYVDFNAEYLEVEGATDRRVRTVSIAHKKNSTKAPSVSAVRKTGSHTAARGTDGVASSREIVGDFEGAGAAEHWKLTSTMQGLGDSNNLVEVVPGICRFGPLRTGHVYRMSIHVRNLDVDITRFKVTRPQSPFLNVQYQPQPVAPGMAAKITVEIVAGIPARLEQLIEVTVKAHLIRVPVTARIFDAEEYDRLNTESLQLHGRAIGRHQ